jgi:hypothetical protein
MFGNFLTQFGLDFPFQTLDAQGGLFAPNAPTENQQPLGAAAPGGAGTGLNMTQPATNAVQAPPGATGGGATPPKMTDPGQAGLPQANAAPTPSPLASPLAPGGGSSFGQPQNQLLPDPAPAAGVGSQFNGMKQNG